MAYVFLKKEKVKVNDRDVLKKKKTFSANQTRALNAEVTRAVPCGRPSQKWTLWREDI